MENLINPENYFNHETGIGIIGHGESIEASFVNAASVMFSLISDLSKVHLTQIITFEFEEEDIRIAFIKWLNLLLAKAQEHSLIFGDFRLKREGKNWKATIAGGDGLCSIEVERATCVMLSVNKMEHVWEARCVVDIVKRV